MKKLQLVLVSLGLAISASSFAQVAIGTDKIHPSAILHLESDTNDPKGFLLPTMTNAERLAILSPADGLQVYVTDFQEGTIMFFEVSKWNAFTKLSLPDSSTASVGQAAITFKTPSNTGIATSSLGDITGTTTELDLSGNGSITVTGLTTDLSYTFSVKTTNIMGSSEASKPSD